MEQLISVIVPIYNLESCLEKCIASLCSQTWKNLEIILVNDGSTDRSKEIMEKWASNDPRILSVSQDNAGVSAARNTGLEIASGDWIGFVDGDDYLHPEFYETLIREAVKQQADVVCLQTQSVDSHGRISAYVPGPIPERVIRLEGDELWQAYFLPEKRILSWAPWDKLIRADLARSFRFEPGRKYGEDFFYDLQILAEAGHIVYIPRPYYNYFLRPGSATHSARFLSSSFDMVHFAKEARKVLQTAGVSQNTMNLVDYHEAVVTSRIVRWYTKAENKKDIQGREYTDCIEAIRKKIRNYLKHPAVRPSWKMKLLMFEAGFAPWLFYIR